MPSWEASGYPRIILQRSSKDIHSLVWYSSKAKAESPRNRCHFSAQSHRGFPVVALVARNESWASLSCIVWSYWLSHNLIAASSALSRASRSESKATSTTVLGCNFVAREHSNHTARKRRRVWMKNDCRNIGTTAQPSARGDFQGTRLC